MKLGLDIHGVIDVRPEFFSKLTENLLYFGWEIHVITGSSIKEGNVLEELTRMDIHYTHTFSVYDHLKEIGAKTNEELGIASRYPFPDEIWNVIKSEYCAKHDIDMHIDDMSEYLEHFTTPFMTHKDPNRNHRGQFGEHESD